MNLIWWIIIIAVVLIVGIVGIFKWTYRKGRKGYDRIRRR